MKTFKLEGLEYYTCATTKTEAQLVFFSNKMAVAEKKIEETSIKHNPDAVGQVFKSLEEYENFNGSDIICGHL